MISAALAVSFIFASGLAKSTAQWVMNSWQVSEYWMPFVVGCIFMPALLLFVYLLEKIPSPGEADKAQRMERLPMSRQQRRVLVAGFLPGICSLVVIYVLVTILREVRDSFMADMWRESGEVFNAGVFASTETVITVVILILIAAMMLLRNNFRAFMLAQVIMLLGFVISLVITLLYMQGLTSLYSWMLLVGLGLYMVYIPFNSILFDRFIAAFRLAGNVGFLIYLADSFGYLGSVGVLLIKTILKVEANWLQFYQQLVLVTGLTGLTGTLISLWYFRRKYALSGMPSGSSPSAS